MSCISFCLLSLLCLRAMRMHSADYAVARCPSVIYTPALCWNPSSKFLTVEYNSNFSTPNVTAIFRGYIVVECRRVWKIAILTNKSLFIADMIQDRAILRNTNTNSYAIYRMVLFPMTLSDLERLSEIFNDTKHRTASLQQMSFLFFCLLPLYS